MIASLQLQPLTRDIEKYKIEIKFLNQEQLYIEIFELNVLPPMPQIQRYLDGLKSLKGQENRSINTKDIVYCQKKNTYLGKLEQKDLHGENIYFENIQDVYKAFKEYHISAIQDKVKGVEIQFILRVNDNFPKKIKLFLPRFFCGQCKKENDKIKIEKLNQSCVDDPIKVKKQQNEEIPLQKKKINKQSQVQVKLQQQSLPRTKFRASFQQALNYSFQAQKKHPNIIWINSKKVALDYVQNTYSLKGIRIKVRKNETQTKKQEMHRFDVKINSMKSYIMLGFFKKEVLKNKNYQLAWRDFKNLDCFLVDSTGVIWSKGFSQGTILSQNQKKKKFFQAGNIVQVIFDCSSRRISFSSSVSTKYKNIYIGEHFRFKDYSFCAFLQFQGDEIQIVDYNITIDD